MIAFQPQADSGRNAVPSSVERINVEVTDTERIEFQKAAERCGLTLADWIHDRLNECAKREAKES